MDIQSLIATKRDGKKHTEAELQWLANAAAKGSVKDYQLSAWLMAAYIHTLDAEETAWLTMAMADSGERIDLTGLPKPWVDKHSTGGVGDKTTLVVLPILAACGLTVVKMSGRGLGITGGTVDKLSSIPGFRLDLRPEEVKAQAKRIGLALTGQTPNLAPADKSLYALRDATATVSSVPLIVSSILSKKLAGGAETVVLDVKCGSGAFMRTLDEAKNLAESLIATAKLCGLKLRCEITEMNQPLGAAVGNALEVDEALRILRNDEIIDPGTARFRELCLDLAGFTLFAAGKVSNAEEGRSTAESALVLGRANQKASEWFLAQGAKTDVTKDWFVLPRAAVLRDVFTSAEGWVQRIEAEAVGRAVVELGGGRKEKEDLIDLSVGVVLHAQVGSKIEQGDRLLTIHARNQAEAEAAERSIRSGIEIVGHEVIAGPSVLASY